MLDVPCFGSIQLGFQVVPRLEVVRCVQGQGILMATSIRSSLTSCTTRRCGKMCVACGSRLTGNSVEQLQLHTYRLICIAVVTAFYFGNLISTYMAAPRFEVTPFCFSTSLSSVLLRVAPTYRIQNSASAPQKACCGTWRAQSA